MTRLSSGLNVRLTPALRERIEAEADRLGVRPSDVVRVKLGEAFAVPQNTTSQDVVSGQFVKH